MNLYFDTEFTGLHKNTTLISIGIISDTGETFYAELTDYDKSQLDEWIQENVINNLLFNEYDSYYKCDEENNIQVKNTKQVVAKRLETWLSHFDDEIQFISDVSHYDMVLLIDLFGTAFNLPENVSASCHDINQDIALMYGISEKEAFNKCREDIILDAKNGLFDSKFDFTPLNNLDSNNKHNSLYDAMVIKIIYSYTQPN